MLKKVSVIIPCYNDGYFINEAILSVKNQIYPNIEIIVVDDASDDKKTKEILENLNHNIKIIILERNGGPGRARNVGIENSTGDYILCLDADDRIEPTYIQKAIDLMQNNPKLGIVYCKAKYFGKRKDEFILPDFSIGRMLICNIIFITSLFNKHDWEKVGGFDESLRGREDWDFWLSILELGVEVARIDEILFQYRIKKNSRDQVFMNIGSSIKSKDIHRIRMKHIDLYTNNIEDFLIAINYQIEGPERENISTIEKCFINSYTTLLEAFKKIRK